ncbi:MAG TPA: cysteine hydrolase [Clostridia bacterium]|nr:cysteine hydrolase [Clostridia bacterium]
MARKRVALLVIDMQNDFVGPAPVMKCEGGRDIIPRVIEVVRAARQAGVPVIHVIQEHRRQLVDFGRELDVSPVHCVEGTPGARPVEGLEPEGDDFVVIKRRFSGFLHTDLDLLLKGLGVERLIITGVATDGCVRATAVDAHQLGYRVSVVGDCVAGATMERHAGALLSLATLQPEGVIDQKRAEEILKE